MKKFLLTPLLMLLAGWASAQTIYYWVGGTTPSTSITTGSNWNTAINGAGSPRPSSTGASDILIFDGTNVGGAIPATGPVAVLANGSITCAQMKFVNNAVASFVRASTGTSTITLAGEAGEDFVLDAGCSLTFNSTVGSIRMAMAATNTGRCSGTMSMVTTLQARFDNTTSGTPGSFVFTSGSSFYTNITAASSSYAFGSSSQSSEKWVVFEDGAHLYYDGGYSPMGGTAAFSAIDFKAGSTWHHRANNGAGSFFNRKSFGNIIVENNATLTADGTIYRLNNLTVNAGSTFTAYTSGQTAILGNVLVNGTLTADPASNNELILAGGGSQNISGTGTISCGRLIVADNADVLMNKSIAVTDIANVFGDLDLNTFQLTGAASFAAVGIAGTSTGTGNTTTGSYLITGNTLIPNTTRGQLITGAGIPANTAIVAFSSSNDTIFISAPATATASGISLTASTAGALLKTANTNGFDPVSGSVAVTGNKTYQDKISYIINAATTTPFGVTTGSLEPKVFVQYAEVNAPITFNKSLGVYDHFLVNGKATLRLLDTLYLFTGAVINGTFSTSNYIVTTVNASNGDQGVVMYQLLSGATTIPIGTPAHYMPVVVNPSTAVPITAVVFQGITTNGLATGTALTPTQKQSVVDAVWSITTTSASATGTLQLGWQAALEGSTFTTLPDTDIGLITNTGSSWTSPTGTGDNTLNIVSASISAFGAFSAGAVPPTSPFIFNPLPVKTYGDADFNGGATSLNTTQPIVYSSSNPAVATIVAGNIHIVGAGSANITASQASDGFYPAATITQPLTVNKAALTITADNKTRFEAQPNPALTITYSGFVLGETPTVLLTPVVISTTATIASPPGNYPITVSGATSDNYLITFVNGTLTVQPRQTQTITFNALPAKTYGNADFAAGATSTNSTIPITYSSSNTAVATIVGTNIHIVGAGTSTITASQAGSAGFFPAADVQRTLTVNKAALTIRVRDTTRVYGQPNPPFTITYTGFVLGETSANLTSPPVATTTAALNSSPGYYPITLSGAASNNYTITYVDGRLTVLPLTGTTQQFLTAFMTNSNTLLVRVYSVQPALGDIILYDFNGRPLLTRNLFMPTGFIQVEIPISTVPTGIYIVKVKGTGVDLEKTIPILR